nr:hypothetical protein [uncultured Polynucleobacter sp.]
MMWPYGDKATVYLALVVYGPTKVIINARLVLREHMLRNKKHP